MGASIVDGPLVSYGDLANIPSSLSPSFPVIDPNTDKGPSIFYQGDAISDPRWLFLKDKVQGFAGSAPAIFNQPTVTSASGIPALVATNNIAAAANVVTAVAMTLASVTYGLVAAIPIRTYSSWPSVFANGTIQTANLALDFGFDVGSTVANTAAVTVNDASQYFPGMPLVIAAVGNAAGTAPLLTSVVSVNTTTNVVTVLSTAVPLATSSGTPIGTGDVWGLRPDLQVPLPAAAYPALAMGPGLFFDPRQGMARGIQIVGSGGGAGGTFTVRGWDIYGFAMSETITVGAGAVTGWGKKAFKYVQSVTPNFTDAHNYSVGTSDVFGFAYLSNLFETSDTAWNGSLTATSTGVLNGVTTTASATTGDVRGTVQLSTNGGGSAVTGNAATNGSLAGITITGRRLYISQDIQVFDMLRASQANVAPLFGVNQA